MPALGGRGSAEGRKARRVAPATHKSLNQMVCEYLEQFAGQDQGERERAVALVEPRA